MKTIITLIAAFVFFILNVSAQTVGKPAVTPPGSIGGGGGIVFNSLGGGINCFTIYPHGGQIGSTYNISFILTPATVSGNTVTIGGSSTSVCTVSLQGDTQSTLHPYVVNPNFSFGPGTYFLRIVDYWSLQLMFDDSPCASCAYPYTSSRITIIGSADYDTIPTPIYTDHYAGLYNWNGAANCSITGVDELTAEDNLSVFPNPATTLLTITTTSTAPSQIILYDIASRRLMEERFSGTATLNVGNLAKGVYLYEVRDDKGVMKQGKVVKE